MPTLSQFKVSLVATRSPGGGVAPMATVTARGYQRSGDNWKLIASKTVGQPGRWFWASVNACSLTVTQIKMEASGATDSDSMTVSLLITPATGCSTTYTATWKP